MLRDFKISGKASFIIGGQWGSEGKGAAAAWVGSQCEFDILTTNASAQAGHTSVVNDVKHVVFHLPSAQFGMSTKPVGYLNAGCAIDLGVLTDELNRYADRFETLYIHPNAAIITRECREAEMRADSAQTKVASTRKGVGEALARKALRSGANVSTQAILGAHNNPLVRVLDLNTNMLLPQRSVLVEVPQGIGLSLNSQFYPHVTSRDVSVAQAANDAGIHPNFVGPVMLVLRTFPIRVGNISEQWAIIGPGDDSGLAPKVVGYSGDCYPDQREITWGELGVTPEITTVTKRVRRVFTWSRLQLAEAIRAARPTHVFLSHVDYLNEPKYQEMGQYVRDIFAAAFQCQLPYPQIVYSIGPGTGDVHFLEG